MDILLMIDISGSMNGHKISAVTDALENLKESLVNYSYDNGPVRICVQFFSRDVSWFHEDPILIEDFQWEEPFCTGMTSLGKACSFLSDFLQKKELSDVIKIILMSDGCPTDDYDEGLGKLIELSKFNASDRYAIGLGEEADIPSLVKFTCDVNKVFRVTELDNLMDCITKAVVDNTPPLNLTPPSSPPNNNGADEWE